LVVTMIFRCSHVVESHAVPTYHVCKEEIHMDAIYEPRGAALEYCEAACNLYRGCVHGCRYCYAPSAVRRTREDFHSGRQLRDGILDALRRDLFVGACGDSRVLFCFTSDPYQVGCDNSATRAALEMCSAASRPFAVLTKGGMRAADDFDLYEGNGWFGTTLAFTDDRSRQAWEPCAASVESRIEAIRTAHSLGIRTWVSMEPVIEPAQALDLVLELRHDVDEWRVGRWNHDARANSIDWTEFTSLAIRTCLDTGADFMLKEALHRYACPGAITRYVEGQVVARRTA